MGWLMIEACFYRDRTLFIAAAFEADIENQIFFRDIEEAMRAGNIPMVMLV